ncbi:hypothetical protein GN956_G18270 [Arapaima gigas]
MEKAVLSALGDKPGSLTQPTRVTTVTTFTLQGDLEKIITYKVISDTKEANADHSSFTKPTTTSLLEAARGLLFC